MINFNHLKESQQNYLQHALRVFSLSIILIFLAFIALIHAVFPFVFYDTVSSWIKDIDKKINHSI
jgi:cytochrome bd-type quinol oxidase subunit 2|tara:strand:- start:131 stop:325 length:195 start_codon:yes stop_codon:yes gene_type:complete